MGQDALHLAALQLVHDAACDGDRGVVGVAAGGEGVHRAVLDDVDLGHRQAGADAEVLDEAVEVAFLCLADLVGARDAERNAVGAEVAEHDEGRDEDDDDGREAGRQACDDADGSGRARDDDEEDRHEQEGAPPVGGDAVVDQDGRLVLR